MPSRSPVEWGGIVISRKGAAMRSKLLAGGIVAGLVLVSVGLGFAAPAQAFSTPPHLPNPGKLNVPGSVLTDAANGDGQAAAELANTVEGGAARNGGIPAYSIRGMANTVGGVSQVYQAYQVGTFLGGAIDSTFGIDKNKTMCSTTGQDVVGQVLQVVTGADCSQAMGAPGDGYKPNLDIAGGTMTSGWVCAGGAAFTPSGACVQVTGSTPMYQLSAYWCLSVPNSDGHFPTGWPTDVRVVFASGLTGAIGAVASAGAGDLCPASGSAGEHEALDNGLFPGGRSDTPTGFQVGTATVPITATSSDPLRTIKCTILGSDGVLYAASTAAFHDGGLRPYKNCPTLPAGVTGGHMTVYLEGGPQELVLSSQDPTNAYSHLVSAYPLCATGACSLDLIAKDGSCYDGDQSRCAAWFTDPNKTNDYSCMYGTYAVGLAECAVLANRFDPGKVAAGTAYADPATGATPSSPTSPTLNQGQTPPDTGDARQPCFPNGFLSIFNAGDMVTGVQCALNWAFAPRASVVKTDVDSMAAMWNNTTPFKVAAAVGAWSFSLTGSGNCKGFGVPIPYNNKTLDTWYPMDACSQPLAFWAGICCTVVNVSFIVLGALAIARYSGGVIQFPGISGSD